jgi:hypothetical protein
MRQPSRKRLIASALLAAALSGLGWALYVFLPPEPIWSLDGCWYVNAGLADRAILLSWESEPAGAERATLVVRDLHTGAPLRRHLAGKGLSPELFGMTAAARKFLDMAANPDTPDRRWKWLPSEWFLAPGGAWIGHVDHLDFSLHLVSRADGLERNVSFGDDRPTSITLSPDGTLAACSLCAMNGDRKQDRLVIIETATGKVLGETPGQSYAQFSADGAFMAAQVCEDQRCWFLRIWDVRKQDWAHDFDRNAQAMPRLRQVLFGPDSRTLICTYHADNSHAWALWDLHDFTVQAAGAKDSELGRQAFSRDGRRVALLIYEGGAWRVDVWDGAARRVLFHFTTEGSPRDIVLSPDGTRLLVQTYRGDGAGAGLLSTVLFEVDSGQRLWKKDAEALDAEIHHLGKEQPASFDPDGRSVVIYHAYRAPYYADILDATSGAMIASLPIAPVVGLQHASAAPLDDGRIHVIQAGRHPRWWWGRDWLAKFVPLNLEPWTDLVVLDIASRRIIARQRQPDAEIHVFDQGRRMLTIAPYSEDSMPGPVSCWELPGHGPWRWVVGMPTALGGLIVGAATLRRRRRPRCQNPEGHPNT